MLAYIIFKAFLVGLFGACAAGPIFLLVMNRSVSHGMFYGFATALGTAVVEGVYFALAIAGVLGFVCRNPFYTQMFELVSGMILLVTSVTVFIGNVVSTGHPVACDGGVIWSLISAGLITASNPFCILFYIGIAAKLFSGQFNTSIPIFSVLCGGLAIALGSLVTLTLVSFVASNIGSCFSERFERVTSLVTASFLSFAAIYLLGHVGYSFLDCPKLIGGG